MPAAKSRIRCIPSQMVLTPGSPSPFRARNPPSLATNRTTSMVNDTQPVTGLSTINQEHTAILAALTIKKPTLNAQLTLL